MSGHDPATPPRASLLARVSNVAVGHPKAVIGVWLVAIGVLSLIGLGVEKQLSTPAVYVPGTKSDDAEQFKLGAFGNQDNLVVLLRGPAAAVDREGRRLTRALGAMPRSNGVVSPWAGGSAIKGLRPRPGAAGLVVNVTRLPGEKYTDVAPPVQKVVDDTVRPPVRADLAGQEVIALAARQASLDATQTAELISFPVLAIVLLFVFGSPVAAMIPGIIGGATVGAGRGVVALLNGPITFDALAPGIAAMMGLALGVDYSLLMVSRFREEVRAGASHEEAARTAIVTTGRSVVFAGIALLLAMFVAANLLPGAIVHSVAVAVIISSLFSVFAALFVVPAMLVLAGPYLERFSIHRGAVTGGWAARFSERLTRRPILASLLIMLVLFAGTSQAFGVNTGFPSPGLLPKDSPGRQSYDAVSKTLGAGWGGSFTVLADGGSRPITTPARLTALARFQRRVTRDKDVVAMAGVAPLARSTRPLRSVPKRLDELNGQLASGKRGLARLDGGLTRAHDGARQAQDGLRAAAAGARLLSSGTEQAQVGSRLLHDGLQAAASGSNKLLGGMRDAYAGSRELVSGAERSGAGAGRLAAGIDEAAAKAPAIPTGARQLAGALRDGRDRLGQLREPIGIAEEQLAKAYDELEQMTVGKADPRYAAAFRAVATARGAVTGKNPVTGQQVDPRYNGLRAAIDEAQSGLTAAADGADKLASGGDELVAGLNRLKGGARRLQAGIGRLTGGNRQLAGGLAQLADGGARLAPGLELLASQTGRLTHGLGLLQAGGGKLGSELGSGATRSGALTAGILQMTEGVRRQQGNLPKGGSGLSQLQSQSPNFFRSGYFYLASVDGAPRGQRRRAGLVVNVNRGGHAARMAVIPTTGPIDEKSQVTRRRIERYAAQLERDSGMRIYVGGDQPALADYNQAMRDALPVATLVLALITLLVLVPVLRSVIVPLVAVLLNVVTVGATYALLALLFNDSLLGGPGYIDTISAGSIVTVIFGLSIDYEVFVLARMREEYVRTGDPDAAVQRGLAGTARVVTGAAVVMIAIFVAFAFASFISIRNFGVALGIAVALDAFVIRLIALPAIMRWLGRWCWWMPRWLDRIVPHVDIEGSAYGRRAGAAT
jgi:RND superfamily putative drug exporter